MEILRPTDRSQLWIQAARVGAKRGDSTDQRSAQRLECASVATHIYL
jgi:hypothetical protein